MKKIRKIPNKIFLISAVFGLIFAGCNTSVGPGDDDGTVVDLEIQLDGTYGFSSGGAEVPLESYGILDISKYASFSFEAKLYTDAACTQQVTDT